MRFKPHGSVETADISKQRGDFVSAMQFLPIFLQAFPTLALQFRSVEAGRAMGREFIRLFRIPNPQAFLGSPAQDLQQALQAPPGAPIGPPAIPGAPPAGAPIPGPPGPAPNPSLPPSGFPSGGWLNSSYIPTAHTSDADRAESDLSDWKSWSEGVG